MTLEVIVSAAVRIAGSTARLFDGIGTLEAIDLV